MSGPVLILPGFFGKLPGAGDFVTRRLPGWVRYDEGKARLSLDPEKAKIVRKVFALARAGFGVAAIAQKLNADDVPVLGRIAAGTPILAAEHVEEVLPLPVDLVGSDPVFLLEVKGDSMVDAGILDGDLVAVRSQDDARDGEIVAALIDGEEATVKRLRRRGGKVILEAANPAYEPLVYSEGVELVGKVVSVLRRYA